MPTFVDLPPLEAPPEARIERLEDSFTHKLPESYRGFIRSRNGAKLVHPTLPTDEREVVIELFLPIVGDIKTDPMAWADVAVVEAQLGSRLASSKNASGPDLIPIAALFGGDFIVLDYRSGAAEPEIALWLHETSEDFAPDTVFVAKTFDAFLKMLK